MTVDIDKALEAMDAGGILRALFETTQATIQNKDALAAAALFLNATEGQKTITLPAKDWDAVSDMAAEGVRADDFAVSPGVVDQTTEDDKATIASLERFFVCLQGTPYGFPVPK